MNQQNYFDASRTECKPKVPNSKLPPNITAAGLIYLKHGTLFAGSENFFLFSSTMPQNAPERLERPTPDIYHQSRCTVAGSHTLQTISMAVTGGLSAGVAVEGGQVSQHRLALFLTRIRSLRGRKEKIALTTTARLLAPSPAKEALLLPANHASRYPRAVVAAPSPTTGILQLPSDNSDRGRPALHRPGLSQPRLLLRPPAAVATAAPIVITIEHLNPFIVIEWWRWRWCCRSLLLQWADVTTAVCLGGEVVVHLGLEAAAGLVVLELGAVEEGYQDEDEDGDGAGYDADYHGRHGPLVLAAAERVVVIGLVVAADALGHFCGRLGGLVMRSLVARQRVFLISSLWASSAGLDLFGAVNFGTLNNGMKDEKLTLVVDDLKPGVPRATLSQLGTVTKGWAVR